MNYPELSKQIRDFYERGLEAGRLSRGIGVLEFERTKELLRRFLPDAPGIVYDVGGGSGVYSRWLTKRGYTVFLVDPVPYLIEQARQASTEGVGTGPLSMRVGDARQLNFEDETADVVLLMGPLYHLLTFEDRQKALGEAYRVLKPGGMLVSAAISCYASTNAGLYFGWIEDQDYFEMCLREIKEGVHQRPASWPNLFAEAFFHRPEQLREEIVSAGYCEPNLLAVQGPAWFMRGLDDNWKDDAKRKSVLQLVRMIEADPIAINLSPHFLGIARKPA